MKKMMISLCLFFSSLSTYALDANEMVRKADLKRGLGNTEHTFTVQVTNTKTDKKELYKVFLKNVNSTLTEQLEPEKSKGRKMLMKDYDIWLFTPNIKKPIRISLEQKLTGEVSNGDIAKTNYAEDYDAKVLTTENTPNGKMVKLELVAKNKKVTYGRIEYSLLEKDFSPQEAIFFALSGKPLKRARFLDYKKIQGEMRATKMIIQDYIQKEKESVLVFDNYKKESLNESMFNKDSLEF